MRRAQWALDRLVEYWDVDRLAALRIVATALAPMAEAACAARLVGDEAAAGRWAVAAGPLVATARETVADHADAGLVMGAEGRAWLRRMEAEAARLQGGVAPSGAGSVGAAIAWTGRVS